MLNFYRTFLQTLFPGGLNRDALKLLIIVSMTIDHIAYMFPVGFDAYIPMRTFGKLTFPLVALFIAEGFYHTRSRPDYFFRLSVFALLSQIPFMLAFGPQAELNVMYTLALSVLFLMVVETPRLKGWQKSFLSLLIFVACGVGDWKYFMPAMVYLHYKRQFKWEFLLPLVFLLMWVYSDHGQIPTIFLLTLLGIFLSLPLVESYNGQKGSGKHKLFFYWFYPAHLLVLYLIKLIFFPA